MEEEESDEPQASFLSLNKTKWKKFVNIAGYLLIISFCWFEKEYPVALILVAMYVIDFLLDWHWT